MNAPNSLNAALRQFDRWMQESGIWQGDDYLWCNRYRALWQSWRASQQRVVELERKVALLEQMAEEPI